MQDDADAEAEKAVDLAHPLGVAPGQVVVHRDHVHAASGEGVEIDGQGGDQGFAFAGLHFGDAAVMQHHAAHELNIEMALAEGALGSFAHGGEGGDQQAVQIGAIGELAAEFHCAGAQLVIGECRNLVFERVDGLDITVVALQLALVRAAENAGGQSAEG